MQLSEYHFQPVLFYPNLQIRLLLNDISVKLPGWYSFVSLKWNKIIFVKKIVKMRRINPLLLGVALALWIFQGCTSENPDSKKAPGIDKDSMVQQIKQLEDTLKANSDQHIDRNLAKALIDKSVTFAEAFPEDQFSPGFLFRAGNVAVGIGSFADAANYFEMVHQKYSSYERAPDALFLEGFTYENHLNNIEKAKECYTSFLSRFPDDELAEQVKIVLENIGKSPEELVKSFQEK